MARVLGVLRLSRMTEDSTSIVRQREVIEDWVTRNGHEVVGFAEDSDVSGLVAPWERPSLGQWLPREIDPDVEEARLLRAYLDSRAGEFDVLAAWKVDRYSRRLGHVVKLGGWCTWTTDMAKRDRRVTPKSLVGISDGVDTATPMGKMLLGMLGIFADAELEAIKTRTKASHAHLRRTGRYTGGPVPYGYRPERNEAGNGFVLVVDEGGETATAPILRDIVASVMAGESLASIARWLNENKVPTSTDVQLIRGGKAPKGTQWNSGKLSKMLQSPAMVGQSTSHYWETEGDGVRRRKERLVIGDDGLPVQRAEPLIPPQEWRSLLEVLEENKNNPTAIRRDRGLLLQVIYCACGEPMYSCSSGKIRYYRCATGSGGRERCGKSKMVRCTVADDLAERAFLSTLGAVGVKRRTIVRGESRTEELRQAREALEELEGDRAAGLYRTADGTERYRSMHVQLEERIEHLSSLPQSPDMVVEEFTGETYGERWAALHTDAERNTELRAVGMRIVAHVEECPDQSPVPPVSDDAESDLLKSPLMRGQEVKAVEGALTVVIPGDALKGAQERATVDGGLEFRPGGEMKRVALDSGFELYAPVGLPEDEVKAAMESVEAWVREDDRRRAGEAI